MTRVLTGSADLLSSVWCGEGVLASRVEGVLGRMTVGRVELRPEVGRCASSVVTASTEACVSSCCLPDVGGDEGLGSARSLLSGRDGRGVIVWSLLDRAASGYIGPTLVACSMLFGTGSVSPLEIRLRAWSKVFV